MSTQRSELVLPRRTVLLAAAAPVLGWALSGCGGAAALVPFFTFQREGLATVDGKPVLAFANLTPTTESKDEESGSFEPGPGSTDIRLEAVDGAEVAARTPYSGTFNGDRFSLLAVPEGGNVVPERLSRAYEGVFIEDDIVRLTPDPRDPEAPVLTLALVYPFESSFRPGLFGGVWEGRDTLGRDRTLRLDSIKKPGDPATAAFEQRDAVVLFEGTETIDNVEAKVEGSALMRMFEMTITRGGQARTVRGRLAPASRTPLSETPAPEPVAATAIELEDGSRLTRRAA